MVKKISPETRLKELGITLDKATPPAANYISARRDGSRLYLSGKAPLYPDGRRSTGKVGEDVSIEEAYKDARQAGLNLLATLRNEIGSLDKVDYVIKLLGFVNGAPDFYDHSKGIDGCSDLLVEVFGENGRHARTAIGVGSLPNNITVEVELVVRFKNGGPMC